MKRRLLQIAAGLLGLVVLAGAGAAVAGWLYDRSHESTIAEGVRVAGVDVGGLQRALARELLRQRLLPRLERPVRLDYGARRFRVGPDDAALQVDLDGMVAEAVARSRSGDVFHRVLRDARGRRLDARVPLRVRLSPQALDAAVARIGRTVARPAVSARVVPTATSLRQVPSRNGIAVRSWLLRRIVAARLRDPRSDRELALPTRVVEPEVATAGLVERYPVYLTVCRGCFQLRLWKNLRLAKVYPIAVGRAGLETPSGVYTIDDKQVNPSWHVPKSAWAGELAGRVIPPGPNDPIKSRWMGFYDGAGIHGTADDASIGSAASHGCIRMHIWDVEQLYDEVPYGTPIFVG